MESIKEQLLQKVLKRYPEWEAMKFINHSLGLFRDTEHDKLVNDGAISCHNQIDSILSPEKFCNYFQEKYSAQSLAQDEAEIIKTFEIKDIEF